VRGEARHQPPAGLKKIRAKRARSKRRRDRGGQATGRRSRVPRRITSRA